MVALKTTKRTAISAAQSAEVRWLPIKRNHATPLSLRGLLCLVAASCGLLCAPAQLFSETASADDAWNPFAEKDRQAAKRAAARKRQQANERPVDQRPYLAPMSPGDIPRPGSRQQGVPQPYPAVPPGYANSYQPPGSQPGQAPGAATYSAPGSPGTYVTMPPSGQASFDAAQPSVERGELTPVISSSGGLPAGAWQGLDAASAEQLLSSLPLPPASPALSNLLDRIMSDPEADQRLNMVRSAALLKAGRFDAAARLHSQQQTDAAADPISQLLTSRLDLATGNTERGCVTVKRAIATQNKLPKHLRGEAIVMAGYCAIAGGNAQAGGLAAELAREAGFNRPFTLAILDAIASGDNVRAPLPRTTTTLDGLLIRHLKSPDPAIVDGMLQRGDAGFLQLVAIDPNMPATLRLKAAERAAAANILSPSALADAYRTSANALSAETGQAGDRARQFIAAERQQAQFVKTRAIRALLDSAKREQLYHPVAVAAAPIVRTMRPAQEISWFTETAIEALAAGGDYQTARQWVQSAPPNAAGSLDHWLMLLDIADPEVNSQNRGRSISVLENLALQGRFTQPALHRLATVLDALDYNVPIPLWNLASRTEQPQTGHLPETGILSAMKQASEQRQIAATTLYALRTIAPAGTTATHLLGLGDTIRALKRAGLEKDARRLGFEALFADWPRTGGR